MTTLIADLESDGLLDTISQIWQLTIIDAETEELTSYNDYDGARNGRPLTAGYKRLLAADRVVFHHGLGYDLPALEMVTNVRLDWRKMIDTLVLSKLGNPNREGGHSIAAWGERLKGVEDKVTHEDWTRWSYAMEERCNVDTRILLEVYKRLVPMLEVMPEAVAHEHHAAYAVMRVIKRGFKLNVKYTEGLLSQLQTEQEGHLVTFQELFPPVLVPLKASAPVKTYKMVNKGHALHGVLDPGVEFCPLKVEEFNPESRVQIAKRLARKYGWVPVNFTPAGAPECNEDILRDLPYPEAKAFADYLVTAKLIGQINSQPKKNGHGGGWLHHVKEDGRVHANLNPLKAITGRLSCSSPNIQQASTDKRMRSAWVPGEGLVLVGVDAEGLELRCLSHYLEPLDGGAYIKMLLEGNKKLGTDVHSVVRDLLGFYDRNETKRAEYGWLYGAGDRKLGLIQTQDAYKAGAPIRYDILGVPMGGKKAPALSTIGKAARSRLQEGIVGLGALVDGVKLQAKRTGRLRGLDGRTLWTRSEHSALNFLLQSAGIIIVKRAWMLIEGELASRGLVEDVDYQMVMQVHDEFQFEATPEAAQTVGEGVSHCIVRAGQELGFRCPLAGSFDIGNSWAETH